PVKEVVLFYKRNRMLCNVVLFFISSIALLGLGFMLKLKQNNIRLAAERDKVEQSRAEAERNRAEAERNRADAERERERVNRAMAEVISEKHISESLIRRTGNDVIRIFDYTDRIVFLNTVLALDKAMALLKKIAPSAKEYNWAIAQTAYVHFLRQEFKQANKYYLINPQHSDLYMLSKKFATKAKSGGVMKVDDFIQLLKKLLQNKYRIAEVLKMLQYDSALRKSTGDKSQIVKMLLRHINPAWVGGPYVYNAKTKTLSIHGKGFVRIAVNKGELYQRGPKPQADIYVTKALRLKRLDVSGTEIISLDYLKGSKVIELDIRRTPIRDLSPLTEMLHLKRLIISVNHFDKTQLASIPAHITIEER
ncbi:MAG: hypothetical protein HRT88_20400, partial [Lentisphaeraceae bacterium]|nr:hypothetical protein [Lentisphaeraceae bacterium]